MASDPNLKLTEMDDFIYVYIPVLKSSDLLDNIMEGPCRLFSLLFQGDSGEVDYLKLYDSISPVGGTTDPDYSFYVNGNTWFSLPLDPDGLVFANGLSLGADDAGGTALGTSPAALNVQMTLLRGAS